MLQNVIYVNAFLIPPASAVVISSSKKSGTRSPGTDKPVSGLCGTRRAWASEGHIRLSSSNRTGFFHTDVYDEKPE